MQQQQQQQTTNNSNHTVTVTTTITKQHTPCIWASDCSRAASSADPTAVRSPHTAASAPPRSLCCWCVKVVVCVVLHPLPDALLLMCVLTSHIHTHPSCAVVAVASTHPYAVVVVVAVVVAMFVVLCCYLPSLFVVVVCCLLMLLLLLVVVVLLL